MIAWQVGLLSVFLAACLRIAACYIRSSRDWRCLSVFGDGQDDGYCEPRSVETELECSRLVVMLIPKLSTVPISTRYSLCLVYMA